MQCPICGGTKIQKPRPDLAPHPYERCDTCMLYFQPQPCPKTYEGPHEISGDEMSEDDKRVNEGLARWLADTWLPSGNTTALDIGAKFPYLMHALQNVRPTCKAHAVDGISEVLAFGDQLGVCTAQIDVETIDADWWASQVERYELVTLVHCLEHFADPVGMLQKIASLVNKNGVVFVRSPAHDVAGIERDFTAGHFLIHPIVLSRRTMRELATRAGLVMVYEAPMPGAGQCDYVFKRVEHYELPRIGVGLIVKNEERDLPAALKSIAPFANVVHVVDTGSTDNTAGVVRAFAAEYLHIATTFEVYTNASERDHATGEWKLNDFSQARNRYVDRLEGKGVDWIFSLDADDIVENPKAVRGLIARAADAFDFQIVDNLENPTTRFNHLRLWRAERAIYFEGPCHEYPVKPLAGDVKHVDGGLRILHRWAAHAGVEASTTRNLRILERAYTLGDRSSRNLFYLANSYRDVQNWAAAIRRYEEYLALGEGWHDEKVFACLYLARSWRFSGQPAKAVQAAYRGLAVDDRFSELWMELAYSYELLSEPGLAKSFAKLALREPPKTPLFLEPNKYTDQPWRVIARCAERLGDQVEARQAYERVLAYAPNDADMRQALDSISADTLHVVRPGAAGDILCLLNALQTWAVANPGKRIVVYTNPAYADIVRASPVVSEWRPDSAAPPTALRVIGYPRHEGYPDTPMKKHLIRYFCDELGVEAPISFPATGLRLPTIIPPCGKYVTLQVKAGWSPYKEWPLDRWAEIVSRLTALGYTVFQIGGHGEPQVPGTVEGRGTMLESIALITRAEFHLGIDSVGNHATNVVDDVNWRAVPTAVIVWGSTSAVGSGYGHNINVQMGYDCAPCYREYEHLSVDKKPPCPYRDGHGVARCMADLPVSTVWAAVERAINS